MTSIYNSSNRQLYFMICVFKPRTVHSFVDVEPVLQLQVNMGLLMRGTHQLVNWSDSTNFVL